MKFNSINTLFPKSSSSFVPLAGNSTADYINTIHEILMPLLLSISNDDDERHNIDGLITQHDQYKVK